MRKVITLFEYSPAEKEELDHLKKLEEKLAKINRMMGVKILEKTFTTIKATHYVGVISIGNTTIQILPKLYNSNKKNREEIIKDATRNLLFMLTLTKRLKIREVGISKLKKEATNLYEVIIYLFAKNLFEMLKYNYKRDYEQREKDLKFIKGKIRMSKQIRKPTHHKIHCSYFDLSENILIHRILKYTCYLLSSRVRSRENWLLLQNILSIYDNVELKPTKLSDFDKIRFNRLNEEYEPFVNLARLFLENMSLELQSSHFVTFSLLFDMNTLFEEFLGEILKKHRKELLGDTKFNECKIYLNKRRKWLIEDPRSFKLRPDIILSEKERVRLIIDAKYKLLDSKESNFKISQTDVYQMFAYSHKFKCKKIILLYPWNEKINTPDEGAKCERTKILKHYKFDKGRELYVATIDLMRDLRNKNEFNKLKRELKELFKSIE